MKTKKMNKVALFSLCAMFAACSEYDPADLSVQQITKINEYSRNFEAKYGKIDPNHNWGFGSVESMSNMSTRAESEITKKEKEDGTFEYNYNPPTGIDESEQAKVKAAFKEADESEDVFFIWGIYYVQHVYSNPEIKEEVFFAAYSYKSNIMHNTSGNRTVDNGNVIPGKQKSGMSNKNQSQDPYLDKKGNSFALFTNMGYDSDSEAKQFGCTNADGKILEKNYIILVIDGSYYLGFDLGSGNYTDWIVKLLPAGGNKSVRIMCEDLGSTSDFDFNDIVFDYDPSTAEDNGNGTYNITVLVQAAGGTIPVYIGRTSEENNEVHKILGGSNNDTDKYKRPINVGLENSRPAKARTIKNLKMDSADPINIPLYRININAGETKGQGAVELIPNNSPNNAPFKICVPTKTRWTVEHGDIGKAYAGFSDWVQSEENNTNAGFSDKFDNSYWTEKEGGNSELLMDPNPTENDEDDTQQ